MINKRTLKIYREFKSLKKRKHLLTREQYVKELEKCLADFNADIESPELTDGELNSLFKLVSIKVK